MLVDPAQPREVGLVERQRDERRQPRPLCAWQYDPGVRSL